MKEVLWGAMDEDTLDLVEQKYDEAESTYKQIKAWIIDRNERNIARRANSKKGKNDMDVGALNENEHDERSECSKQNDKSNESPTDENDETALSAFGKGGKGGKGGGKGPMTCYTCNGAGHPQRLCPTTDPNASMECHNCKGKGHYKSQCTSEGGGQYVPYTPKGKGKDNPKGYGKGSYGKGGYDKGGYGKGGYGKAGGYGKGGKGKGQLFEMDWHEPQPWMTNQDSWNDMSSFGYGQNQFSQWDMPRSISSVAGKIKETIQIQNKFEKLQDPNEEDEDETEDMMKSDFPEIDPKNKSKIQKTRQRFKAKETFRKTNMFDDSIHGAMTEINSKRNRLGSRLLCSTETMNNLDVRCCALGVSPKAEKSSEKQKICEKDDFVNTSNIDISGTTTQIAGNNWKTVGHAAEKAAGGSYLLPSAGYLPADAVDFINDHRERGRLAGVCELAGPLAGGAKELNNHRECGRLAGVSERPGAFTTEMSKMARCSRMEK